MGTVKIVIFISCIIGVIGFIFDFAIPEGSVKKQFGFILGLVTVLSVISPFTDKGFQLSEYKEYKKYKINSDFTNNEVLDKINEQKSYIIENKYKKKIEEYFLDKLNKHGIKAEQIDACIFINSHSEIEITKIYVRVNFNNDKEKNQDIEKIKSLIAEDLKECSVEIVGDEDRNEDSR